MKKKKDNIFRNFLAKPKPKSRGKEWKFKKFFLSEHIKSCQEAWKEEEKVKYFWIFLQNTFLICQRGLCKNIFVHNTSGFARREIPWEHMFSKYCSLAAFGKVESLKNMKKNYTEFIHTCTLLTWTSRVFIKSLSSFFFPLNWSLRLVISLYIRKNNYY